MERSSTLYVKLIDYSNNPNVIQSCINELNNFFNNTSNSNKVSKLIEYTQHQLFYKLAVSINNKELNEFNEGELATKIAETIFNYINHIIIYSTNENRLFNCKDMIEYLYSILSRTVIENDNHLQKFIHLLNTYTIIIKKYIKLTSQEIYIRLINNMIDLVNTYLLNSSEATMAIINHLFDLIVENDTYKSISQETLKTIIDTMITILEVPHQNDFIITQCFSILIFFLNNVNWSVQYYQDLKWIPLLTLFSSLKDQQKNIIYLGQIMEKIVNFSSPATFLINDIVFLTKTDLISKDYDEHRPDKRHTDVNCLFIMYLILIQNNKTYIDTLLEIKVDDFLIDVIQDKKKIDSYVCKNSKAMHYLMYILCTILLYKPSLANDTFYYSIKNFIDEQDIIKLVCKSLITLSYKNSNLFADLFLNEGSNTVEDIFSELLKRYYDQYWMIEFINYIKESDIYPAKMIEQQTMSSYEMDFERNNTNNLLFKFAMQPRNKIITSSEMLYTIKAYVDIEIENIINLCEGESEVLDKDSIDKFNKFTLFLFTMMMNKELCYDENEKSEPICTFLEAISLLSYEDFEKLRKNKIIYNIANQFNILYLHSNVKTESIIELSSNSAVLECLMKILETKDKELVNLIFPTLICVVDIDEQFKHFVQCNGLSLLIELLCNKEVLYEKNSISGILRDITRKYIINVNHNDIIIDNLNQFSFVEMCDNIRNIDISSENIRTNDYYSMIYFFYELCMLLLKEGKKVSCGDINVLIEESRIVSYLISQICKAYLKDSSFLILSSKNENDSNIFKQIMLLLTKLSYYDNHIKYLISNEFLNFIKVILTNEEEQNLLFIIQNVCFILTNIFNNAQYGKWLLINKNFISMFVKLMKYIENNSKIINNNLLSFYDVFDCIIKIEHTDWDKSHLINQGFLTTLKTNYINSTGKRSNSKQSSNSDDFNEIIKEKQMQESLEKRINHSLTLLNQFEVGAFLPNKYEVLNSHHDEIPKERIEWINAINKVKKNINRNKSKKDLTVNLSIESVKKKNRTKSPIPQSQKLYSTHSIIIEINKIIKRVLAKQNEEDFIRLSDYLHSLTYLCKHEESFNYIINNSIISELVLILNNDYFIQDVQETTYKLIVRLLRNDKENRIANRIIHDNENLLVLLKEFNKIIVSCTPELTVNLELRTNAFSMLTLNLFTQNGFIEEYSNYFIVDDIIKATNILRNYKSIVRNLMLIIKHMIKLKKDINSIELQSTISELCTLIFDVLYNKDISKLTQKKEKKENLEIFNILIDIIMIINSSVFFINSFNKENFNNFIKSLISLSITNKVILYKMFPFFTAISKVHHTLWTLIQQQKKEIQNVIVSNRRDTSIVSTYIEFFTMLIDKNPNLNYETFQNSLTVLFTNYGLTKNNDIKSKLLNFVLTIVKKEERNLFFHEKNADYMMILKIMKNDININNPDLSCIYITILSLLLESNIKNEIITKNKQYTKKTMKYLLKVLSKFVDLKAPQLYTVISLVKSLGTYSKDIEILDNAIKYIFALLPPVYQDRKLLLKLFELIVSLALVDTHYLIAKEDFIMQEIIKMYDNIKEEEVDKEFINLILSLILSISNLMREVQPNDNANVNYKKGILLLIEMIKLLISKDDQCSVDNVISILNSITNLLKYSTENMVDNIFVVNNNANKTIYLFLYKYLIKINDDSHEIPYLDNMVILTQSVILSKEDYSSLSQTQYVLFEKYVSNGKLRQLNTLLKMMKQLCDSCDKYKDEFKKEGQILLPKLEQFKKDKKDTMDSILEFHIQCMIDTLK